MTTPERIPRSLGPRTWLDSLARRIALHRLGDVQRGALVVKERRGTTSCGVPGDLAAVIHVHRGAAFRAAVFGGSVAFGESYVRGEWDCDDLPALFRILIRNQDAANRFEGGASRVANAWRRLNGWRRANTRAGSRRNIRAHYDLGNDFFRVWLDDTLAYSSAVFPTCSATLEEASTEKFDRVCRKLDLKASDSVAEIGAGWGGFAIHAASRYGCRVTSTTISPAQLALARARVDEAGLGDRVALVQRDYRDFAGEFDKLASIEMIEAVGHEYLDAYFRRCSALLRPTGSFVLQAILMPDRGYDVYLRSTDFIRTHVFPGGRLPSLGAILAATARATDLRLVHAEEFAPHYAETLRRWRLAFESRLAEVRALGYSDELIRLWRFYLASCEAGFQERHLSVMQLTFDKPACRRDPAQLSVRAAAVSGRPHAAPAEVAALAISS